MRGSGRETRKSSSALRKRDNEEMSRNDPSPFQSEGEGDGERGISMKEEEEAKKKKMIPGLHHAH